MRPVEIPTSAPNPKRQPSANLVDAFLNTQDDFDKAQDEATPSEKLSDTYEEPCEDTTRDQKGNSTPVNENLSNDLFWDSDEPNYDMTEIVNTYPDEDMNL